MKTFKRLAVGGAVLVGAAVAVGGSASAVTYPPVPVGSIFVQTNTGGAVNVNLTNGKKPVTTNIFPTDPCVPPSNPPFGAVTYNHVCLTPTSNG